MIFCVTNYGVPLPPTVVMNPNPVAVQSELWMTLPSNLTPFDKITPITTIHLKMINHVWKRHTGIYVDNTLNDTCPELAKGTVLSSLPQ